MNLSDLSLLELRQLKIHLSDMLFDFPHLTGLTKMKSEIEAIQQNSPDYQKGEKLYENAKERMDSGYANPEDYYFAVVHEDLRMPNGKSTGKKTVTLLLCYKFNWWRNGQAFLPTQDGSECRNFHDFVTAKMQKRFEETYTYTKNPEELRIQLIKAGLEELPALIPFYLSIPYISAS